MSIQSSFSIITTQHHHISQTLPQSQFQLSIQSIPSLCTLPIPLLKRHSTCCSATKPDFSSRKPWRRLSSMACMKTSYWETLLPMPGIKLSLTPCGIQSILGWRSLKSWYITTFSTASSPSTNESTVAGCSTSRSLSQTGTCQPPVSSPMQSGPPTKGVTSCGACHSYQG